MPTRTSSPYEGECTSRVLGGGGGELLEQDSNLHCPESESGVLAS